LVGGGKHGGEKNKAAVKNSKSPDVRTWHWSTFL
jgi:hypothetical protein